MLPVPKTLPGKPKSPPKKSKEQNNKINPQNQEKNKKEKSPLIVSFAVEKSWVFCFFCMPDVVA